MGEEVEHNCLISVSHNLDDAYAMAIAQQHRGKDSTGIFARGEHGIDVLKWIGPVSRFNVKALHKIFTAERYHTFGIHGKYRTKGEREINLNEVHPICEGGVIEDRGSHIFVHGVNKALMHNGQVEQRFLDGIDQSRLKTKCDSEGVLHFYSKFGIESVLTQIPDGYTLAIADLNVDGVVICRGRHGLKPGVRGNKGGFDLFASESVAFSDIHATLNGDITPGAVYYLRPNGKMSGPRQIVPPERKHCMFEFQYVAHPKTLLERLSVAGIRQDLGEKLFEEFPTGDADFVTYIPESPKDGAQSYANRAGIPLVECFYKINDTRSFQAHTPEQRNTSISENLYLLPGVIPLIMGKKLKVLDDSIVRGTVIRRSRHLLGDIAKVKEEDYLSLTPKIGIIGVDGIKRGCDFGGIDMPAIEDKNHSFIARGRTDEQINNIIGARVGYLSIRGFEEVYRKRGLPPENLCTFCIGGKYPFRVNGNV
ncbi:MAG: hypothetical protein WCK29_02190 [archaeon]